MKRVLTALALLLVPPLSVLACLWDQDTPASEAKGMPEVVAVLTGRFVRNPPLYYEMRLERVTVDLQSHPEDLAAYDDAGVACDRLGRGDEAVSWMEKKRAQLDRLDASRPDVMEQSYRYHANLGTFLVHRWLRQGADRTRLDEVEAARDQIAKALEINPKAHFGRETYQLQALGWIIDPPLVEGSRELPNLLGWPAHEFMNRVDPHKADDAVRGLAGLIVLGDAWESVDIFHALNIALQHDSLGFARDSNGGRNSLATFAWLRCRELIDAGKGSILPDTPKGRTLKDLIPQPDFIDPDKGLADEFAKLRAEADAWHAARTAFMTKRLKEGRHPDIDRDFWSGYTEQPAPGLPTGSIPYYHNEQRKSRNQLVIAGVFALAFGLAVGWSFARAVKARRGKPRPVEDPLS
jgi:hypothetical protein